MKRLGWITAALIAATSVAGGFERPSANDRAGALGNLYDESEVMRRLLTPDDDFAPIPLPGPNDWLQRHEEPGQTFDAYRDSAANRPTGSRRIIYLLPIGKFSGDSCPPLEEIRDYASRYFQLEVRILPACLPDADQFDPRQNPRSGQRQILTTSVEAFLKTRLPADAYCLLGVTMTDLYPSASWNYVFGEASLSERVGVYSFARYDPKFWDETRPPTFREIILQRSCKVLAHEIGHMFGLMHCIYFRCVLNGGNHMVESDASPQYLCPICLRKIHFVVGFDPVKRYTELAEFYGHHGWTEELGWAQRQLAKVPKPAPEKVATPARS